MDNIISTTEPPQNDLQYEKYNLQPNILNFYNTYKENLSDIFGKLFQEMLKLTPNINEYSTLLTKIRNHPIIIEEYNIKCYASINEILITNYDKNNCFIPIDCIKIIKVKDDQLNTKREIFTFNYQLAMIILSTNKYIYCYKNEEGDKNLIQVIQDDDNSDEISIISNACTLENEINKNKIIHTTNEDVYNINQLIERINFRNNDLGDPNYFINGINSYNFRGMKNIENLGTKIDLINSLSTSKNGFFIYNKEIGLTLKLLDYLHIEQVNKGKHEKYFYINIDIIGNSNSNNFRKKFIIYYLGNLFNYSEEFKIFYDKISYLFSDNLNYSDLLFEIIEKFVEFIKEKKLNNNFYFFFDNIYNKDTFNILIQKKKKFENEKNIHFYFFVQLNRSTVDFLFTHGFTFINIENNIRPLISIEYLNKNNNNNNNYLKKIKSDFNNIISQYNDLEIFILVLKAKYIFLTNNYQSKEDIKNFLINFSDFFNIYCKNEKENIIIQKIDFINEIVKEFFIINFNANLCNFINNNNLGVFDDIINSAVEGILLEKDIIF